MALLYFSNTKSLFMGSIYRALQKHTSGSIPTNATLGVTIYSGVAPSAKEVADSWATYNSSSTNYLVYFNNMVWTQPGNNLSGSTPSPMIQMHLQPTARTPVRNGIASWAIIWACPVTVNVPPTLESMSSTTIPSPGFLVVNVSEPFGDGIIRFSSTSFNTSTPVTVFDASMASFI